jgi:endo-1,4-beta-xylanase
MLSPRVRPRPSLLLALPLALVLGPAAPARAADPAHPVAHPVVPLWPANTPTLKGKDQKEVTDPPNPAPGGRINKIENVHAPSIEVRLPPPGKGNGTGVIVAPGGGHRMLVWGSEGTDIARWLNELGIAAFILKYRLEQTKGFSYTVEGEALDDTKRAIRIVRQRAKEWGVDPAKVGVLGFSAGGALAALAAIRFDRGKPDAKDPVERQSCRPDFVGLVYPGWKPMDITAPADAPPAFLTSAGLDDAFHARQTVELWQSLFAVKVAAELHIYQHGGHGGAIKERKGIPFGTWHVRFQEWMADLGYVKKPEGSAGAAPK